MICASLWLAAAFCATCLLYHIRFVLSRGFWKVFWSFFQASFLTAFQPPAEVPDYYITSLSFCQEVFEKFFKNFCGFFGILCFSQSDPISISHLFSFVKRFFKSFSTFFDLRSGSVRLPSLAFPRCSRSVLAYYSTSSSNCQGVFFNFFHFGSLGTLS